MFCAAPLVVDALKGRVLGLGRRICVSRPNKGSKGALGSWILRGDGKRSRSLPCIRRSAVGGRSIRDRGGVGPISSGGGGRKSWERETIPCTQKVHIGEVGIELADLRKKRGVDLCQGSPSFSSKDLYQAFSGLHRDDFLRCSWRWKGGRRGLGGGLFRDPGEVEHLSSPHVIQIFDVGIEGTYLRDHTGKLIARKPRIL